MADVKIIIAYRTGTEKGLFNFFNQNPEEIISSKSLGNRPFCDKNYKLGELFWDLHWNDDTMGYWQNKQEK